jgi:hypothetical protein
MIVLSVFYLAAAFMPLTPDPFGPAVPNRVGYIVDVACFLMAPAVAAALLFRWKAKRLATLNSEQFPVS